jgi:hypothetical protein
MSSPIREIGARVFLCVVTSVLGCGRVGIEELSPVDGGLDVGVDAPVDARGDARVDAHDGGFVETIRGYISPDGDDANPGSMALPWLTFSHALSQLGPGETLVLLDGTYGISSGNLAIECDPTATACAGEPCPNGTAAAPITVRAHNERVPLVTWDPSYDKAAVDIVGCEHWRIEGLRAENQDFPDASNQRGAAFHVGQSRFITLRRLLGRRHNRYFNSRVFLLRRVSDVLVEECEAYEFARTGFVAGSSSNVTFRRCYANSRHQEELVGGYATNCPNNGDIGFSLWNTINSTIENSIAETLCVGFRVGPGNEEPPRQAFGNLLVGNVAVEAERAGFQEASGCQHMDPCTEEIGIARDNRVLNNVALSCTRGFETGGVLNGRIESCTSLLHSDYGFHLHEWGVNAFLASTVHVLRGLASSSTGTGFRIADHADWSVSASNAFGHASNYSPTDSHVVDSTEVDPTVGSCRVYLPPGSAMIGAAPDGSNIGASVIYRYRDGVETSTKLWDQATGHFPCGATIAGFNDPSELPSSSCATVHERLSIGVDGCPIP